MDFLQSMNNALNYIESQLDAEIDYKVIENLTGCTINSFQRIFSYMTDINLSEYIRRRRMTLAAFELQNSGQKIIDLALKYGYESPDAFSRAFQHVHNIRPSEARNSNVSLKAYPRISFHVAIKGDTELNYRITKKSAFQIIGVIKHFRSPDDANSVDTFWNEIYENGIFNELMKLSNGDPKGVHGFIQVLNETDVDYTIACITDKEPKEHMNSYTIPESLWAIFEVEGPINTAMSETWKRIFSEWLPTSNYKYAETIDVECFPYQGDKLAPDYKFEIWLPVIKNE